MTGIPVYPGGIVTEKGMQASAFLPIAEVFGASIEAVANDRLFGIGAIVSEFGPFGVGVFAVSDYHLNFGVAVGINFRF